MDTADEKRPAARIYTDAGLPCFGCYGGDGRAVAGADKLKVVASVAQTAGKKGKGPMPDNTSIDVSHTVKLRNRRVKQVREGAFTGGRQTVQR